ncbi:hypothetical protein [Cellulophaga baltica]|uniref:hypothetical protein n=1 Tax=Cellulophaga baltica TaxID=76594 RepID=UPI0015F743A3|nr:hypothetical protein [Cellulophaga baltica]MBA6316258.1 hypothetical protein [Cellulophaga baltica]
MNFSNFNTIKPVFTTKYVLDDKAEIVYFSIDEDSDLHFLSDEGASVEHAKLVSLESIINLDMSLNDIPDFEKGDKYYRNSKNEQWQKLQ